MASCTVETKYPLVRQILRAKRIGSAQTLSIQRLIKMARQVASCNLAGDLGRLSFLKPSVTPAEVPGSTVRHGLTYNFLSSPRGWVDPGTSAGVTVEERR